MARVDTRLTSLRRRHQDANNKALEKVLAGQRDDVLARLGAGSSTLLTKRWDSMLAEVVLARKKDTAGEVASRVAKAFGVDIYDPSVMDAWLIKNAGIAAERINDSTRTRLAEANGDEGVVSVLDVLLSARLAEYALDMVTSAVGFSARDTAGKVSATAKMWQTNSSNPRSAHAAMGGETVPVGAPFSNGMDYPGDPDGSADEVAGCQCSMTIL